MERQPLKYCAIILTKDNSVRLPHKNYLYIKDKQVWEYVRDALSNYRVYDFHQNINRPKNASRPDEPIWQALKWAYKSIGEEYDAVINIMANCPMITSKDVEKAVKRFEQLGCQELRSFNEDGSESGLMIVKTDYLLNKHEVSTYQGAITINSIEIHTKQDLEKCRLNL